MHVRYWKLFAAGVLLAISTQAQNTPSSESLIIATKQLPKASLWQLYKFRLKAEGGIEPYHWTIASGSLPHGFALNPGGEVTGIVGEVGQVEVTAVVFDSDRPPKQQRRNFILSVETPLIAEWGRKAQVNGMRIDGSLKVSNRTGRDFDLTVIVLAVNDIGRATAIGYQHFPLKQNTRDLEIPFGDTLSPGDYAVNVDVVGEEPVSNRIFRARLVTGKERVTQGP